MSVAILHSIDGQILTSRSYSTAMERKLNHQDVRSGTERRARRKKEPLPDSTRE